MHKLVLIQVFIFVTITINAQIYQFRGPNRDGKFIESGLLKEWPVGGPSLLLEYNSIGDGWSSVISNGKYIYASGNIDTMDYLTCLDFKGIVKWKVAYGKSWKGSYPSTRGTPTIEENRIYIISGIGELVCLNAETGIINWKINADLEYKADWHRWGVAESPLIVDDKVICSPTGFVTTFVAFDKITGKEIWKTPSFDGQRSYASPVLHTFNNKEYILGTSASDLYIVDPENGNIKTSYKYFDTVMWPHQPKGIIWANSPLAKENMIFISIGYNYPAKMLKVNSDISAIEEVYTDTTLDNQHHGLIELDGYIYGSNWIRSSKGNWVCLEWNTGNLMYEEEWYSKGEMIYADGLFITYEEKSGHVGLVKATPTGFNVISEFKIEKGKGQHWSHPYINNGKLFLRHGEVLMVYNLKE